MQYEPHALPPKVEELRAYANAIMASRAILVGSALREADNGKKVQSYSLFIHPGDLHTTTGEMVQRICDMSPAGSKVLQNTNTRYEIQQGDGDILNVNFCHRPWMLEPDTMAKNVPNGLSQIAMDLFTNDIQATQLYRLDRREHTITQDFPFTDPDHLVAKAVQTRYPAYPIISGVNGEVLVPALKPQSQALHAAL